MWGGKKSQPAPVVPLDRVQSIAQTAAPAEYIAVGKTGKRRPRQTVYKQAILQLAHGEQLPVVVRNLSLSGCRLEFFKKVRPSGRVLLKESSLPLETWAEVAWIGEGACGLQFEDEETLLQRMPHLAHLDVVPVHEMVVAVPKAPKKGASRIRKIPSRS